MTHVYPSTMICESPQGDGLHIDHLPEFFDYDTRDNSLPHIHTFYEIIWFQEDGGTHTVDFQTYDIKANELLFLSPGQVHHFDGKTRHKGISMKFCTDFLKEENDEESLFIKYSLFNTFDSEPFCSIDPTTAQKLSILIQQIEEEKGQNNAFAHMDMLRALVKMFLIQVKRHGSAPKPRADKDIKAANRLFVNFRQMLEQQYRSIHTVGEYASMLNVSTKTLCNSITNCSGQTPLNFINDRIILEAKRMLKYTDMMVKEISYYLGFDDPSYFVKLFKRVTGHLPSEFRDR